MIRELWRDGAVYAAGTIVSRGLALLLMPLVTRLLAPADYGVFDLVVTAGVLVNLVVPLETPQALARFWNEREAGAAQKRLAGTAWTFAVLGYGGFVALAWAAAPWLAPRVFGAAHVEAWQAGAVFIGANGVMLLLQSQFRWERRALAYAVVSIAYGAGVLLLLALLAWRGTADAADVLWAHAAASLFVAAGARLRLRGSLAWGLDAGELRAMLRYALPLVPAGVAVFAATYLHRWVLGALGTLDDVGLFGVAARLGGAVTLVLIGVQTAITPLVYAHHRDAATPATLARLAEGFWCLALLACGAMALFARELLGLLAGPQYAAAAPLIAWLAVAALLGQMYIFAPGIPIAQRTGWQLAITVAAAAAAVLLGLLLVPLAGARGAAMASVASAALFLSAWIAAGQRLYPLPLRWRPLAACTIAALPLGAAGPVLDTALAWPLAWALKLALLAGLAALCVAFGLLRPSALRPTPAPAG